MLYRLALVVVLWTIAGAPRAQTVEKISGSLALEGTTVVGDVGEFAWSPDGRYVVYGADRFDDDSAVVTCLALEDRSEVLFGLGPFRTAGPFYFPPGERFVTCSSGTSLATLISMPFVGGAEASLASETSLHDLRAIGQDRVTFRAEHSNMGTPNPYSYLLVAPLDGSSPTLQLSPPTESFSFVNSYARAGQRVVFSYTGSAGEGLRSAPLDGSSPSVLIDAGSVVGFVVRAADERAFYIRAFGSPLFELWTMPADASAAPVRLNPTLAPEGDVDDFRLTPNGQRVVYVADQDVNNVRELYSVPADGGASVQLSGSMTAGGDIVASEFLISPDGARVVYLADQSANDVFELYSAPIDGSQPAVRLHPALSGGQDVRSGVALITPDSRTVVFAAELNTDLVVELFAAPIDGSAPPVRLNAPLVAGGNVITGLINNPTLDPDGRHVYYLADQNVDQVYELFSAPVDGSAPPTRVNGPLVPGGSVQRFAVGRPGKVLYSADQDTDGVVELYFSRVDRPSHPWVRRR
jgi:hypothetical protein